MLPLLSAPLFAHHAISAFDRDDSVSVSGTVTEYFDLTEIDLANKPDWFEDVSPYSKVPVVVDGGFMRGADVVKGLCLGADVVGMGRLEGLAMAAGGGPALVRALEIVEREIQTTLALLGIDKLADLNPDLLERATPVAAGDLLSAFPLLGEEGY